jgi:DNA-binding transcriptional MerR regulator
MSENLISPKEIAEKYGIPYSTVNHYTLIGLLTVTGRKKNIRLYDEAKVRENLARIADLRSKGYPLSLIQKELRKNDEA